jgi:hypothetical protein
LDFLAAERDNDDQDNRGSPPGRGRDLFILSLIRRLIQKNTTSQVKKKKTTKKPPHTVLLEAPLGQLFFFPKSPSSLTTVSKIRVHYSWAPITSARVCIFFSSCLCV